MSNGKVIAIGILAGIVIFAIVYATGGTAEYCATPIGPCTKGHK